MFIDFLYANITLGPPKGLEDKVLEIKAFRGQEYITGCYSLSPEELEEINRTGVLWVSFMGNAWPPVKLDAFIPAHRPFTELKVYGEFMQKPGAVVCLYYLDLSLVLIKADPDQQDFIWRPVKMEKEEEFTFWGETKPFFIYDLEYRVGTSAVHTGSRYLFSEKLEALGRFKDLERLHPLKLLYPFLNEPGSEDYLVLAKRNDKAQPKKIITLYQ